MGSRQCWERAARRLLHGQAELGISETHGFESLTIGKRMRLHTSNCLLHMTSEHRAASADFNYELLVWPLCGLFAVPVLDIGVLTYL